ncbi:hypothetical protein ACP70R_047028 [Stipagrostis hirtigluma subsp. patula]
MAAFATPAVCLQLWSHGNIAYDNKLELAVSIAGRSRSPPARYVPMSPSPCSRRSLPAAPPPMLQLAAVALLILSAIATAAAKGQQAAPPMALPGCPDKCGNITIPYPFGTKDGCYFSPGFFISCNLSTTPPSATASGVIMKSGTGYYLGNQDNPVAVSNNDTRGFWILGLVDIDVAGGVARVAAPVSSDCSTNGTYHSISFFGISVNLSDVFLFSATRNALVGVGQSVQARLSGVVTGAGNYSATCTSTIDTPAAARNGSCLGLGCCSAELSPELGRISVNMKPQSNGMSPEMGKTTPCTYAMVVDKSWYSFSAQDLYGYNVFDEKFPDGVPLVLDFAIRNESCAGGLPAPTACRSGNSVCVNATQGPGYLCKCREGYDGNPYLPNGCQDIDECMLRDMNADLRERYPCHGIYKNRIGGYDCQCQLGMKGDAKNGTCTMLLPVPAMVALFGIIGVTSVVTIVVLLKLLLEEKTKTREFFLKNGGPTLEKVNNIKIFKKEELKPIIQTRNVIGKGGFGEVYKGLLDNQLVAIKKSINVDKSQEKQFANEIVIQSRVIHKNIIKLIGCCLEVDVPMLVYEFAPNGSLDDILHGNNKVRLSLDMRLSIAAGAAEGLAYMHSKTSNTILHGDIKPGNILLDENFDPKISDFGISRLIAIDKSHTKYVIGDMGYVDPIYIQSGLLTKQSDVYSFGVVLLELMTRKKTALGDNRSLVNTFLDACAQDTRPIELFDTDIVVKKDMEILRNLCTIISQCLRLDVNKRPEMTEVAEQLQRLKKAHRI